MHRREHALLAARAPFERVPPLQLALTLRTPVPDARTARRPRSARSKRRTRSRPSRVALRPSLREGPVPFQRLQQLVVHAVELRHIKREVAAPKLRLQ